MARPRAGNTVTGMLVRLALILAVVLGLTVLIGVGSVRAIQTQIADFRENVTPVVDGSSQLQTALTIAQSDFRGFLLTQDPALQEDYAAQHMQARQLNQELGARPDVVDPQQLQAVQEQTEEWFELTSTLLQRPDAVQPQDIMMTSRAYDQILADYDQLRAGILQVRDARRAEYTRVIDIGQVAVVLAGLFGIGTVLLTTRQVRGRIAGPLAALGDVVREHQRGAVEVRAGTDAGTEEVREVAAAFNRLAESSELANQHLLRDMETARLTGAVSSILASSVGEETGWDQACSELGRSLHLDGVVIVANSSEPPMRALGHWNLLGQSGAEAFPDGIVDDSSLDGLDSRLLILAETPEEILERFPPEAARVAQQHGVQAWVLATLAESDRIVGVLSLVSHRPRRWADQEVAMIERVALDVTQFLVERELVAGLRDLDRHKSDFVATTSHELRTPLTSISGYLEMLEEGDLGELSSPQRRAVTVLSRNVSRLRGLIEDLLILNRFDSIKGRATSEVVDLHRSTLEVLQSLEPLATKKGVRLEYLQSPGSGPQGSQVIGDRDQIERALTNVVGNAVKFTHAGQGVTVCLGGDASEVELVCQDCGIGIPEDDMEDLFTRFFRASNAIEQQVQGSGLGLPIVLAIVKGHQGTLDVSSVEGEGTRVAIRLPRAQPAGHPAAL